MKNPNNFWLLLMLFSNLFFSQEKNSIEFDLLRAPVSPGSNLLGFSQSDIDKPTDLSNFMVSFQSATNSYTKLPSNYAIDFAPILLFDSKTEKSLESMQEKKGKNTFNQSFLLSFAIKNVDTSTAIFNNTSTYAALGFKFSIIRGRFDTKTSTKLSEINGHLEARNKIKKQLYKKVYSDLPFEIDSLKKERLKIIKNISSEDITELEIKVIYEKTKRIDSIIEIKIDSLININKTEDSNLNTLEKKIKEIASDFQFSRVGFSWDISGGLSNEFRNKNFDNSKIFNAGAWTTIGYTWNRSGSLIGLVRYLHNPDQSLIVNNINNINVSYSSLDSGIKYTFGDSQSKFNCSLETIYRHIISTDYINSSWRLVLNTDYTIQKNQKLTFSFGRNYDGTINKDGNLIAALGVVFGFGNKR